MSEQERSPYAFNYAAQWWAAVVVALVLVGIGGIQSIGPEALGIEPITLRWLGIVSLCLGAAQAFLPKVQAPPIKNYDEVKRAEALESTPEALPSLSDEDIDRLARRGIELMREEDMEQWSPVTRMAPHG